MLHDNLLDQVAHRRKDLGSSQGLKMPTGNRTPYEIENLIVDKGVSRERQPWLVMLLKAEINESADKYTGIRGRVGHLQAKEPILLLA